MRPDLERYVVTAVLVSHDGARWLPETLKALLTQTRPVSRLVAVDTGSTDRGPSVLAEVIGEDNLMCLEADVPFADAVAQALRHPAARMPVEIIDPIEWIWLIHDDSAPSSDALERLLTAVDADPNVAIAGPKLRDWQDRRLLLELGVAIDGQGRRETGVERGELDQGQHDGIHDVLAVSTAGMLVRRDVWVRTSGLDPAFGLFRDDIDLGWRTHAAGHRVIAVSDAVVFHAEATARGLRELDVRPRRLDRRNAMLVLLANLPARTAAWTAFRLLIGSLIKTLLLLVAKRPMAMGDELDALRDVLTGPRRLRALRRARAQNRTRVWRSIRKFQPHWVTLRRLVERIGASIAPTEYGLTEEEADTSALDEQPGIIRRLLAHPSVVVLLTLTVVSFLAERSLIATGGRLGGGALVPAWGSASDLWNQYISGWHQVGLGSADAAPPSLAVLAALSAITLGKTWLAVLMLLLGCVPLAGLSAYFAAKKLVPSGLPVGRRAARLIGRRRVPAGALWAWLAVAYALLPVVSGAVAAGRLGTCVVYVLLPMIGLLGARVLREPQGRVDARQARRAAWGLAVLLTVAMAFVPLTWVLMVIIGGLAHAGFGNVRGLDVTIALATPPLLLLPTTIELFRHPSRFLLEAGLHRPELVDQKLSGISILTLDPGGPGTSLGWATAGLLALAVAALPLRSRRTAVTAGWMLILFGFLTAIAVSAITVEGFGGERAPGWPGVSLVFATGGLMLAAGAGLQRAIEVMSGRDLIYRLGGFCAVLIALSTPALVAVAWIGSGVDGPVGRVRTEVLPPFVAVTDGLRARTLVLTPAKDGRVGYTVLRGSSPGIGDERFRPPAAARNRLAGQVAELTALQSPLSLNRLGIQYVFVRLGDPVKMAALVQHLDGRSDLVRLSRTDKFAMWRLTVPGGRLMLLDGQKLTPIVSHEVGARIMIPAAGPGRRLLLAEPTGGWRATLDGQGLKPVVTDGWAASWEVPASGGLFELNRGEKLWHLWIAIQSIGVFLVIVLALPGGEVTAAAGRERERRRIRRRDAPEPELEPVGITS